MDKSAVGLLKQWAVEAGVPDNYDEWSPILVLQGISSMRDLEIRARGSSWKHLFEQIAANDSGLATNLYDWAMRRYPHVSVLW
jgi:hypothetical protein